MGCFSIVELKLVDGHLVSDAGDSPWSVLWPEEEMHVMTVTNKPTREIRAHEPTRARDNHTAHGRASRVATTTYTAHAKRRPIGIASTSGSTRLSDRAIQSGQ